MVRQQQYLQKKNLLERKLQTLNSRIIKKLSGYAYFYTIPRLPIGEPCEGYCTHPSNDPETQRIFLKSMRIKLSIFSLLPIFLIISANDLALTAVTTRIICSIAFLACISLEIINFGYNQYYKSDRQKIKNDIQALPGRYPFLMDEKRKTTKEEKKKKVDPSTPLLKYDIEMGKP